MNEKILKLRELKHELIGEINKVAVDFINHEDLDSLEALTDEKVKLLVKDLGALKIQLVIFLDALENYMRADITKGEVGFETLKNMLQELVELKNRIDKIATTDYGTEGNVALIQFEMANFVSAKLVNSGGLIDRILAVVPTGMINNLLSPLKKVKQTVGYSIPPTSLPKFVGDILAILNSLKVKKEKTFKDEGIEADIEETLQDNEISLTDAMIEAESEKPLKPMRDFLCQALAPLEKKTKPELTKKAEVELNNKVVIEAKTVLVDPFNKKIKELVEKSADVIDLATASSVEAKIEKLKLLRGKIVLFLQAVDNYLSLPFYALGITELSLIVKTLAELNQAIQDLEPTPGDITKQEAFVQEGINSFMKEIANQKRIISDLIESLSHSKILSASLWWIKNFGVESIGKYLINPLVNIILKPLNEFSILMKLIVMDVLDNGFMHELIESFETLIPNMKAAGLPESCQKNASENNMAILNSYFDDMLDKLKSEKIEIDSNGITLSELIKKTNEPELAKLLTDLDIELDQSQQSNDIRNLTVQLVLVNDEKIYPEISRKQLKKENINSEYLQSVGKNFLGAVKDIGIKILGFFGFGGYTSPGIASTTPGYTQKQKSTHTSTAEKIHTHVTGPKPGG